MKNNKSILSSFISYIKNIFSKKNKKVENKIPQTEKETNNKLNFKSNIEKTDKNIKSIPKEEKEKKNKPKDNKFPHFKNLKALIVEDNPTNQKMIKYTLQNIGIECDIAKNGSIGVDMRIQNRYDIIFMDIQMPIMNGIEATKAILEYEKKKKVPHVPIVAVTANALKGDRERFLAEGMDEYISKPVDFNRLVDVLSKFCSDKQISKENKDILLYKKTRTEAKIIGAILEKLGYSVDIAPTIEDFKKGIDFNEYSSIIVDRVKSDIIHQDITQKIKSKNIPSLLFVDNFIQVVPTDKETYTHVTDKITDFKLIQETISSMIKN